MLFIHTYTSIQQPLFRSIREIVSSPDPTLEEGLASGELWPKFLCAGPRIWPKFTRTFSLLYVHAYQFIGCYCTLQIDGQIIGIAYHYAVLTSGTHTKRGKKEGCRNAEMYMYM